MLLLAFRSFFFVAVLLGYSTGIWRLINDYFRREFQTYLTEEVKTNKYLLQDPPRSSSSSSSTPPSPAPSVTIATTGSSSSPLEESIVRVGQVLVAGNSAPAQAEDTNHGRPTSPSNPDESRHGILTTGGPEQEQDEEARWLHYWRERDGSRASKGKVEQFEEHGVCRGREPDARAASLDLPCPG